MWKEGIKTEFLSTSAWICSFKVQSYHGEQGEEICLHQFLSALIKGGPVGGSTLISLLNVYKYKTLFRDVLYCTSES